MQEKFNFLLEHLKSKKNFPTTLEALEIEGDNPAVSHWSKDTEEDKADSFDNFDFVEEQPALKKIRTLSENDKNQINTLLSSSALFCTQENEVNNIFEGSDPSKLKINRY